MIQAQVQLSLLISCILVDILQKHAFQKLMKGNHMRWRLRLGEALLVLLVDLQDMLLVDVPEHLAPILILRDGEMKPKSTLRPVHLVSPTPHKRPCMLGSIYNTWGGIVFIFPKP